MPFTPLHMGPGMALKAVAGQRFSLLAFGCAQIAMDLQPLYGLLTGAVRLHGVTHSYLAALPLAGVAALCTAWIGTPVLRYWNRQLQRHDLVWLITDVRLSPGAVLFGALAGTGSHILLDSIMHADMTPLAPWSPDNALLGLISIDSLHLICLFSGLLGLIGYALSARLKRDQVSEPSVNDHVV